MYKNSDSKVIKYNVLDDDVQISDPPKSVFAVHRKKVFRLSVIVVAIAMVFMLSAISGYFYTFDSKDTCDTFQPVNKVTVRLVEAQNYSCHDNTTCDLLKRRIEEEGDGLRYNFVIGSDMELYIGQGYKCQVNPHLDELHIKLVTTDLLSNSSLDKGAFRVYHIIDEGLKCGNIVQNYSITYPCNGSETGCLSAVDYMRGIEDFDKMVHQSFDSMAHHTIHRPTYQTGIILHKAFRWTACGEASHEAKSIDLESKVITLESLPRQSCQSFNPVNQIDLDIVEDPNTFNCSDNSCSNLIPYIEREHDGFKYNFVINENGLLYIGLGLTCQGNITEAKNLKIKLLTNSKNETFNNLLQKYTRISEIIKEGLLCGKILNNYSVNTHSLNVTLANSNNYRLIQYFENIRVVNDFLSMTRLHEFKNQSDNYVKVIPHNYRMIACDKTDFQTSTASSSTRSDSDYY